MASLHSQLHNAAARDNLLQAKELIEARANPYETDLNGLTAFNHAASNGLHVLEFLTERAFQDTQLPKHSRKWPEYDINTPSGKYGSTLITYAAKVCDEKMVKAMIAAGVDCSVVNGSGWNLLHAAAVMPGRKEVLALLAEHLGHGALRAESSKVYVTAYGKNTVTYPAGGTPAALCRARIERDSACPPELKGYLTILA